MLELTDLALLSCVSVMLQFVKHADEISGHHTWETFDMSPKSLLVGSQEHRCLTEQTESDTAKSSQLLSCSHDAPTDVFAPIDISSLLVMFAHTPVPCATA